MKKIKIIPHDKKDKVKAKIFQAIMNNWRGEHPEFDDDVMALASKIEIFNTRWGTRLTAEQMEEFENKSQIIIKIYEKIYKHK
jgi:hypothetical protein